MNYPPNWPRCPACGDFALDGHITCGRVECDEAACRDELAYRESDPYEEVGESPFGLPGGGKSL